MVKKTVSAALSRAAKEALQSVTGVKKPKPKQPSVRTHTQPTAGHKSIKVGRIGTAVKPKPVAKKGVFQQIDPSALLRRLRKENETENKHEIRKGCSLGSETQRKQASHKARETIPAKIKAVQHRKTLKENAKEKVFLPVSGYRITSSFGEDRGDHVHSGIDLAVAEGTAVAAAKGGTVIFAGWSGGYGYRIVIAHGDGTETSYSHLSDIGVEEGDVVDGGSQIGLSGNTGHSTGPHLHFEVKVDGEYVNPESYFDFGNGLVAKADTAYVSKRSASAENDGASLQNTRVASVVLPAPKLLQDNEPTTTAVLPIRNFLSQQSSAAKHFNRRERDRYDKAPGEVNSLDRLVYGFQHDGTTKRTKRTAATKRRI